MNVQGLENTLDNHVLVFINLAFLWGQRKLYKIPEVLTEKDNRVGNEIQDVSVGTRGPF